MSTLRDIIEARLALAESGATVNPADDARECVADLEMLAEYEDAECAAFGVKAILVNLSARYLETSV